MVFAKHGAFSATDLRRKPTEGLKTIDPKGFENL